MAERIEDVKEIKEEAKTNEVKKEKPKKEEHELCIKAGATAGGVIRCIVDTVKKTGKAGEAVARFGGKATDYTAESCKTIKDKIGSIGFSAGENRDMAGFVSKQREVYSRIGEIIFKEKAEKGEEASSDIIESKEVKDLLAKAKAFEKEIQKIKDDIALRKQQSDMMVIVRRAEKDMRSDDPRVRRVAVRVLERVGTREVLPIVTRGLEDPDVEVRERSAEILHKLADKFKTKETAEKPAKKAAKKAAASEDDVSESDAKEKSAEMLSKLASKYKEEDKPKGE